ncbi:MAG: hypothetical protein KDC48_09110 [Planctomycetes bacterium]|nr:hypothetical protein [Planctomycetota bacterium]
MGGIRLAASLASAGLVLCACGGSAQAAVHEDTLVLEVGGASSSLREALAARGIVIAPPQRVRTGDVQPDPVPDQVGVAPGPRVEPQPQPQPQPKTDPVPPSPPAPTYRVVELGRHRTLIHLAKEYLGDANRFREIMVLNGWNDADTRRLPENQKVRIPIDPPR